jgi:hypothetical protein
MKIIRCKKYQIFTNMYKMKSNKQLILIKLGTYKNKMKIVLTQIIRL